MQGSILFVDDDQSMCDLVDTALAKRGFRVTSRTSADEAMLALGGDDYDVVVTDLNMTGMSGLDLCRRIVENRPDVPVVVVTAFGSMETAIAAIRAGAYDFITKPVQMDELGFTIGRAVQHRSLREEVKRLRSAAAQSTQFADMVGASPAMKKVYELLERVADTDATVLITGESGTGKELVAAALHRMSRRAPARFVPVHCGAIPEDLLESEMFGHERGAFTGAIASRVGRLSWPTPARSSSTRSAR